MKVGVRGIRIGSLFGMALILSALLAPIELGSQLVWSSVWNGTHFLAFALVTLLTYTVLAGSSRSFWTLLAIATLAGLALAAVVELVQPFLSRTGTVEDWITGAAGVLAAASGLVVWRQSVSVRWRWVHLLFCLTLISGVMRPVVIEWKALSWRADHFPLLAEFEDSAERLLWVPRKSAVQIEFVDQNSEARTGSLAVRVAAGSEGGVRYFAGDQDWSPFDALVFEVHNPGDPFRLGLLVIDDSLSANIVNRFTGRFRVQPGWNTIRVPMKEIETGPRDRTLNVRAIHRLLWTFRSESDRDLRFTLDHVRLTSENCSDDVSQD